MKIGKTWYKIKTGIKIVGNLVQSKKWNQKWGNLWYKIKTGIKIVGNCSAKLKIKSKVGKTSYKITIVGNLVQIQTSNHVGKLIQNQKSIQNYANSGKK